MVAKQLSKRLPVNHSLIKSYPRHAYCLSILSSHEECLPWIYCNYIQLYCNTSRTFDLDWFDYFVLDPLGNFNPWFYTKHAKLTREIVAQQPSVVQFVISSLDSGYYVIAHMDDYYVPASPFYQRNNNAHGNLIFGYDLEKKTFEMAGFYAYKMYQNTTISFDDFEQAYVAAGKWVEDVGANSEFEYKDYVNDMHVLKVNERGNFNFDLQCVIEQLEDYLYSRNTSERYRVRENAYEGVFGLSVYGYLNSLLEVILRTEVKDRSQFHFDTRPFYILAEHKKLMVSRIQYMIDQGISDDLIRYKEGYKLLTEQSLYLQQTFLKFMLKEGREDSYIRTIIQKLPEIAEQERRIMADLVTELKRA